MNKKSYEEAFNELESIVEALQDENISIDESISLFKKGIELQKYCAEILEDADKTIVKILDEQGQVEEFVHEKDI